MRDDLKKPVMKDVVEAIKADRKKEAIAYIAQIENEWAALHDIYVDMAALFLDFIAEKMGEESVKDAWDFVGNTLYRPFLSALETMDHYEAVQAIAAFHRAHGTDFTVEQDDEKTVFSCNFCGSGGKLIQAGKTEDSDRHPMNHGTTKKAYSWSWNRTGVPYYCIHSSRWYGPDIPEEWHSKGIIDCEWGRQFDTDGNPINEPCRTILYRTPQKP